VKGLLGITKKVMNLLAIPSEHFALVFDQGAIFDLSALLGTTLIEIAVYLNDEIDDPLQVY
jgi:hypothetical protein